MHCPNCKSLRIVVRQVGKKSAAGIGFFTGAAVGAITVLRGAEAGVVIGSVAGPVGAAAGGDRDGRGEGGKGEQRADEFQVATHTAEAGRSLYVVGRRKRPARRRGSASLEAIRTNSTRRPEEGRLRCR